MINAPTKHHLALAMLSALAVTPALAATPSPPPTKWVKVCEQESGKQACTVMKRMVGPSGDLVASVSLRQTAGSDKVQFIVSMPLGLSIKSGLAVRIDDKVKLPLKFTVCLVAGCYAQVGSDKTLVDALKNGGTLTIAAATGS